MRCFLSFYVTSPSLKYFFPMIALFSALLFGGKLYSNDKISLENKYVTVLLAPSRGGAVLSMEYKQGYDIAYIANRTPNSAGSGMLFVPEISIDSKVVRTSILNMSLEKKTGNAKKQIIKLKTEIPETGGVIFERTFTLAENESGFRFSDKIINNSKKKILLSFGSSIKFFDRDKHDALRCWFGDEQKSIMRLMRCHIGDDTKYQSDRKSGFFRSIGTFGTGFLYQFKATSNLALRNAMPRDKAYPLSFNWQNTSTDIPAGEQQEFAGTVMIDQGGRQSNQPQQLTMAPGFIMTADICAAGETGKPLRGFTTMVSDVPRTVSLTVRNIPNKNSEEKATEKAVQNTSVKLIPGKAQILPFIVKPEAPGMLLVEITASYKNSTLAKTQLGSVIDGKPGTSETKKTWKYYNRKIPSFTFKGTWREIGAQLARNRYAKFAVEKTSSPKAKKRLALYRKSFPFYAELLEGAAKKLGITPERIAGLNFSGRVDKVTPACMGIFFNGPDGPLNCFSKERGGDSMGGLAYMKFLPDKGYAFQVYILNQWVNAYGINSEGLSLSGATGNCDKKTRKKGSKVSGKMREQGIVKSPGGACIMLAMCKNVKEAVAYIENKQAPFSFDANMLLVDRAGHAARLESIGFFRQFQYYNPKKDTVFTAGNYPHKNADGFFGIGDNWQWASNTMLREKLIREFTAEKPEQVSLATAFTIMQSHAAGGMCQHTYDNPGGLFSNNSIIMVSRTSDMYIAHGPPCRVRYIKKTLNPKGE